MTSEEINGQTIADSTPRRPSYEDLRRRLDDTESQLNAAADVIIDLRAERDILAAENARLVAEIAEMKKPEAGEWCYMLGLWTRGVSFVEAYRAKNGIGWGAVRVYADGSDDDGSWTWKHTGPETGDAGRHAADLALIAAGYRLVGGVHPAQGEVKA